jgi:glycosyltransferase involved in cell wall biosynthesis
MTTTADLTECCVVVPCFNEAARFDRAAFGDALARMPWLSLCFVDDGSTDTTHDHLDWMQAQWPARVSVVALPRNVGKAEAVRVGLREARRRAPLCGFWDADLSAPLDELPRLRQPLDERPSLEWVWGIRLRALGRDVQRQALRHYAGRGFATATSLLLGLDSYDTQCGAKLFRSTPLLDAVLAEPFRSRWIFDVELLARATQLQMASGTSTTFAWEQPLGAWHHRAGSKVRPGDFLRALLELLRIRQDRERWRRPLPASDADD